MESCIRNLMAIFSIWRCELPSRVESPFNISAEDARIAIEEIAPYWKGKTFHEELALSLPEETLKLTYSDDLLRSRFIVNETASFRSALQWVIDFEKVLKRGFNGIRREAREKLDSLDPLSPTDNVERRPFLEAVILICDAVTLWGKRHAKLAAETARSESDPVRKKELEEIAAICEWVPENPAALFMRRFSPSGLRRCSPGSSRRPERSSPMAAWTSISIRSMRRILTKAAYRGKGHGTLECMWVAMAQFIDLYISPTGGAINEGYAHWEAVTVGGRPATAGRHQRSDLLFLKSKREFRSTIPTLPPDSSAVPREIPLRSGRNDKGRFWVSEAHQRRGGHSAASFKRGPFEEIYDYAVSGCTEARMPNLDTYTSGSAYINFAAAFEMALYNGRMKIYGMNRSDSETGDRA